MLEVHWEQRAVAGAGQVIAPRCTTWVHPRYYGYAQNAPELMLNLRELSSGVCAPEGLKDAGEGFAVFPPDKFLIAIAKHKSGHPVGGALLRPLAWWWCASNFSAEWLLNFAQLFGLPLRWASYDPNQPGLLNKICDMLENMGSSAWAAFPAGTKIELHEPSRNGTDNPQAALLDRADKQCDLLILGQPVYLYHIWISTDPVQHWYYTSFASNIVSNGQTYVAKAIDHGEIATGLDGNAQKVSIETVHEAGHPFSFGFPYPPLRPIEVEIFETTYGAPDTRTVLFTGQVEKAPRKGQKITASCVNGLDLNAQRLPEALISPRCAFQVYDPDTCQADKNAKKKSATLSVLNDRTIRVTHLTQMAGLEANYFSFGWIEVGTGVQQEIRTVLQDDAISSTVRELVLSLPLQHASIGTAVVLYPGCDGRWTTCQTKFTNDRFFGHPFVPEKNPTLVAVDNPVSQGGKK